MIEKKENYAPRPLSTSWEYPGYQFYAVLRFKGHDADECLRYAALTVQNWLCERIRKSDADVPEELQCVSAERFMDISARELKNVKRSFSEIVSLPDRGIWAFMVREPHPQIAARAFVTNVGLRTRSDGGVEFGVYIDIVDRDRTLPEQDKAFRPQFVRLLFETEGMSLTQVEPMAFRKPVEVKDKRGVGRLKALADDRNNQLPLIVIHSLSTKGTEGVMKQRCLSR